MGNNSLEDDIVIVTHQIFVVRLAFILMDFLEPSLKACGRITSLIVCKRHWDPHTLARGMLRLPNEGHFKNPHSDKKV